MSDTNQTNQTNQTSETFTPEYIAFREIMAKSVYANANSDKVNVQAAKIAMAYHNIKDTAGVKAFEDQRTNILEAIVRPQLQAADQKKLEAMESLPKGNGGVYKAMVKVDPSYREKHKAITEDGLKVKRKMNTGFDRVLGHIKAQVRQLMTQAAIAAAAAMGEMEKEAAVQEAMQADTQLESAKDVEKVIGLIKRLKKAEDRTFDITAALEAAWALVETMGGKEKAVTAISKMKA